MKDIDPQQLELFFSIHFFMDSKQSFDFDWSLAHLPESSSIH